MAGRRGPKSSPDRLAVIAAPHKSCKSSETSAITSVTDEGGEGKNILAGDGALCSVGIDPLRFAHHPARYVYAKKEREKERVGRGRGD